MRAPCEELPPSSPSSHSAKALQLPNSTQQPALASSRVRGFCMFLRPLPSAPLPSRCCLVNSFGMIPFMNPFSSATLSPALALDKRMRTRAVCGACFFLAASWDCQEDAMCTAGPISEKVKRGMVYLVQVPNEHHSQQPSVHPQRGETKSACCSRC